MHYYLADRQARAQDSQATAVLLDESNCVSETPIANVVAYFADGGLISPPLEKILPGITLQVTEELARRAGLPFEYRDLHVEDLLSADEILLTSTPYGLLPATRINSQPVGKGEPGPIYQSLLRQWAEMVGFDLAEQASRFANR
jgi:branched-chain amino acid aminotransferase